MKFSRFAMALLFGFASCTLRFQAHAWSAEQVAGQRNGEKYSADVVVKAESILKENGFRRSAKKMQVVESAAISKAMTALTRQRRELRMSQQSWTQVNTQLTALQIQLKRLDEQQGQLNLQLAQVAGRDTAANNRLVGLIEAVRAEMRKILEAEKSAKAELAQRRVDVNRAEAKYAETVLAIRADLDRLHSAVKSALEIKDVQIAIKVMHRNFDVPNDIDADQLLASIEKRLKKIEQEIFSETIPLDVRGGSMFVDVNVGDKTARMVVDSGASMISLPFKTATALGIDIPADARPLQLVLADGSSISGRLVKLSRVRIGQFEAEDVQAAVLDPIADRAEPLLGMSFLGKFKFEIDANEKTLKMLKVSTD